MPNKLEVVISGDTKQLERAYGRAGKKSQSFGKKIAKLGMNMAKMGEIGRAAGRERG